MAISGFGAQLSDVTVLLREHFEQPFTDGMARDNTLLQRFKRGANPAGKEVQWKIHFAGNNSVGSYAETDDAADAGVQSYLNATIPYRQNQATYGVTGLTQAATAGAGGYFSELANEASESLLDLQNEINGQLLAFSKSATTDIDGIGVIVSDSGTYAGIDRSTLAA